MESTSCLWFTGFSGAGKTTLGNLLADRLRQSGECAYVLDGDDLRTGLNSDLGFSPEDRRENIRRIAEVARLMMDAGLTVIVCAISPYRQDREAARRRIGDGFVEIHVDTPLEVCQSRDPKGLYRKAFGGRLTDMTGVSAPYERPENPDIRIDGTRPATELVDEIVGAMARRKAA